MNQKNYLQVFICTILLVFFFSSANAATDWGTKGVADTSKVTNVVQLTTDQTFNNGQGASTFRGGNSTALPPQAWRKDAKWIAFSSQIEGTSSFNWEICKIMPDGSSFTRLTTNNSVSDSNANFSKDNQIYYNINTDGNVTPNWVDQVWRMNQYGSGGEQLIFPSTNTNDTSAVAVSPDGTMIAYAYYTGAPDYDRILMVANANGSSPQQVSGTYNSGVDNINVASGHYSWSPDSMWLAYSGNDSTGNWIYKVKANGDNHTQLTTTEPGTSIYHYSPVWSPDGSTIVYRSQVSNTVWTYQLRTIDTSGNPLKTLDTGVSGTDPGYTDILDGPSWSPDSKWVTYTKVHYDSTKALDFRDTREIWITNVNTPSPIQLTEGFNDYYPIWAPNGSQILFQSTSSGYSGDPTREDDTSTFDDYGDILILNLKDNYGSSVPTPFPWVMFNPAFTKKRN